MPHAASSYDVFISSKSQDYVYAREAAAFLQNAGLRVFFSERDLPEMGNADYYEAIDDALDGARHMLVVTTSAEHVKSQWVKKEWKTYCNELVSGRKNGGNLVTLLCGSMTIAELPLSLRQFEARRQGDLPSLLKYFKPIRETSATAPVTISMPKPFVVPQPVSPQGSAFEKELALDCGNGVKLELVLIPAGTFEMGSPESEPERGANEKQHLVTISKDFYMGKYTVTQEQYEAIVGTNPAYFTKENGGGPKHPVEQVSWDNAVEFCKKLSARCGKTVKLPTEAQWEYACRAGTKGPFNFEGKISTDKANYNGDYTYDGGEKGIFRVKTTPVSSFPGNRWGLYDMHGNVWEWCEDRYQFDYESLNKTDPVIKTEVTSRVLRGGSWRSDPDSCRSAYRRYDSPGFRVINIGFRVVLSGLD